MSVAGALSWRKPALAVLALVQPPVVSAARRVADFLVPPACVACRQPLAAHNCLCPACWLQVDFIRPPLCDRLGIPLPYGLETPMISARAAADPPVYNRARAVASHGGLMRDLAHRLKYGDQQHVVPLLGRLLQDAGRELLVDRPLLIPIPLARRRLWQRGFNQAAVLADALHRRSGVRHDPMLLERRRETPSQVGLTREQRKDNMSGAFAIAEGRKDEVKGRNVLLIDDVITTGATIEAAARVLRRAGAARIDALSLTLVTDDGNAWRAD
jgi:ComF family protein